MADRQRRSTSSRSTRLILIGLANAFAALVLWRVLVVDSAPESVQAAAPEIEALRDEAGALAAAERRELWKDLEGRVRARISRSLERARERSSGRVHAGNTTVAVHVRERVGGGVIGIEADRALRPASNMKLVTTAVALVLLGPQWHFETPIEAHGKIDSGTLRGDLIVRAAGDPMYTGKSGQVDAFLQPLVDAVVGAGIERVEGALVLDEGSFSEPAPAPGWPDAKQHWAEYCALSGGLSLNRGCLTVGVEPTSVGSAARVSIQPSGHGLPTRFEIETARGGSLVAAIGVIGGRLFVRGKIPSKSSRWSDECTHPDPVELFGAVLRERLSRAGVEVTGELERTRGAAEGQHVERLGLTRTGLLEYLEPINAHSINAIADQVFLASGAVSESNGTAAGAAQATARALERLGLSAEGLVQVDGSGLSRDNRVSARQMSALIAAVLASGEETATPYVASLAVAGESGTLDDRMRDSSARGRVRAKTGFIAGTSALAGVVETLTGEQLVFSILVNYPAYSGLNTTCWKPLQDDICELLVGEGA